MSADQLASADLVRFFREELRLCKVQEGETVLVFTDPVYAWPHYPAALMAAARDLGADSYLFVAPFDSRDISSRTIVEAWKAADMVIGCTTISWLYTDAHNESLASGTRTLMIDGPLAYLRRLFPSDELRRRGYAGGKRLAEAKCIRVTDEAGSDFTLRKDGRKGHVQIGISDRPGRWDNMGGGLVACAPLEDSAEGVYIVNPGDIFLHFRRHVSSAPVEITLQEGRIKGIKGGFEAEMLRERLESFNDPDAFLLAHAGWGVHREADWNHCYGMDPESFYGSVMVSIGRNMFDAPDEHSGLGGTNYTDAHFDICCRRKTLYLDDQMIIDGGEIVPEDLR